MKRIAKTVLYVGMAALAPGACASVSRAADDARDLANHRAEAVAYPNLADMPAKPVPLTNPDARKQTLQSLQADKAAADAQAADLRNQAAAMPTIAVPGQPVQRPVAPVQPQAPAPGQ